jgi:hypothetical protein
MKEFKRKQSLVTKISIGFIALMIFAIITLGFLKVIPVHITYSEGERTGVVNKLSNKGWICKTWEGQMNLGGMASDGNGIASVNTWNYSVTDQEIVKKIQDAAQNGTRTTLVYKQYLINGRCNGMTDYEIVGVK